MFRSLRSDYLDESRQEFKDLVYRLGIRIFEKQSANDPAWFKLQNRSTEEAIMHAYLYELAHRVQLAQECPDSAKAVRFAVEEDALPMFRQWKVNGKISDTLYALNMQTIERLLSFRDAETSNLKKMEKHCA